MKNTRYWVVSALPEGVLVSYAIPNNGGVGHKEVSYLKMVEGIEKMRDEGLIVVLHSFDTADRRELLLDRIEELNKVLMKQGRKTVWVWFSEYDPKEMSKPILKLIGYNHIKYMEQA